MAIALLRTLTRKSKLGFGKYGDFTIQKALDMPQHSILVSAYYTVSSINFTDDILNELRITKEFRIEKPSINKEMYNVFLEKYGAVKHARGTGADKLRKKTQSFTGSLLQGKNHGH